MMQDKSQKGSGDKLGFPSPAFIVINHNNVKKDSNGKPVVVIIILGLLALRHRTCFWSIFY